MAETQKRKLAAIMITDIVGYSAWAQRNESLALELLEEHRRLLRALFASHNGREAKTMGDGFLVEFASALDATLCAIEMQRTLAKRNESVPPEKQIHIRIGLHVGDVVHQENDILGDGVNIAARIEPLAGPGGICLSEDVARQILTKVETPIAKLGKGELKNIQTPIEIYKVVLPWEKRQIPFSDRLSFFLRQKRSRWLAVVVAVLLSYVLLLAWVNWTASRPSRRTSFSQVTSAARPQEVKSIAVLPFDYIGSEQEKKENEYLSEGISDTLIGALGQVPGLDVRSRNSSFKFKGKKDDVRKIGEQLKVGTVIDGSVQKAGNKLRITAHLVTVATDSQIGSETSEGDMSDPFAVQNDICRKIVNALKVRLAGGRNTPLVRRYTENLEAHNLYLKGRYHWNKRTAEGLRKAVAYFKQAIEKDPNYALARAGLAECYVLESNYASTPPKESYAKAEEAAEKALRIDDTLAEAHTALASVREYEWNWVSAEREYKRAIQLNPNYATARHWYGLYLRHMGRLEEAAAEIEQAQELDPLSLIITLAVGDGFFYSRQYDRATEQYRKVLEMDPNFFMAHRVVGQAYVQKGMPQQAIAEYQKAIDLAGRVPLVLADLGYAYAVSGKRDGAKEILNELKEQLERRYVAPTYMALICTGLGEKDQAFAWLNKAYEDRDEWLMWLKVDPWWDNLRSDPRFKELLRTVGLDDESIEKAKGKR